MKSRMIFENVLKNSKYYDSIKMVETTKNIVNLKKYDLNDILNKINSKELIPFEQILIEGYISEYGCIEMPYTYSVARAVPQKMETVYENGHLHREQVFSLEPSKIPMVYPENYNDYKMCFLYRDNIDIDKIDYDASDDIRILERNKYIPCIINEVDFYKCNGHKVEIHCEVHPMNQELCDIFLKMDKRFTDLFNYFIDPYSPFILGICLLCKSVKVKEDKVENQRVVLNSVEYEIINKDINEKVIDNKLKTTIKKLNKENLMYPIHKNGLRFYFNNKDGIQIISKDNVFGFYIELHPDDIERYRSELKTFEDYISQFLKLIKLRTRLSYVSDYRRKCFFESLAYEKESGDL